MQQSDEFMANLWGMFFHQLPSTKIPIDFCGTSLSRLLAHCGSLVIRPWKKFKEFVSDHRVMQKVLHERQGAGKQFRACWVSSFLFVLFVLFWDFTCKKERVEREFWKVFNSGLSLFPLKYNAKLLLSSMRMMNIFSLLQSILLFVCLFLNSYMLIFNSI